jgi:hypothetical protein
MKLNRRERISLISLLAALAALAMDKLLINDAPQSAQAGVDTFIPRSARQGDAPLQPAVNGAPATPDPAISPAGNSAVPTTTAPAPDVFSWARMPGAALSARPALAAPTATQPAAAAEAFRGAHQLSGTLLGPRPLALIGQRAHRKGDMLDGFVLESISEDHVVFVSDGERVTLRVPASWRSETP